MLKPLAARRTIILFAAILVGFLVIKVFLSAPARQLPPRRAVQGEVKEGATQQRMRDIAPAPVIEPYPAVFIGTGDQSAGSWTRQ
jgi:hypothetical protein